VAYICHVLEPFDNVTWRMKRDTEMAGLDGVRGTWRKEGVVVGVMSSLLVHK
jgi:hypothetical protein